MRGKKVAGCGFVIDGGIKLCQLERGGTHRPTNQLAKVTWGYKITVQVLFQDTEKNYGPIASLVSSKHERGEHQSTYQLTNYSTSPKIGLLFYMKGD